MLMRWAKRLGWVLLLMTLVMVPARLVHGPTLAQGADMTTAGGSTAPMTGISPMLWVATLGGLGAVGIVVGKRIRRAS